MGIFKAPDGQLLDLDEEYSQMVEKEGWSSLSRTSLT